MPFRFAAIAPLVLALALAVSAPAFAATNVYYVQGTGDAAIGGCQPISGVPTAFTCDTLRAAVDASNANPTSAEEPGDIVYLQAAGDYTVAQQLSLSGNVLILGRGPRTTTIRGGGSARVLSVASGVTAHVQRLRIAGGNAGGGQGGNILNLGALYLRNVRVSGGSAGSGGGIASVGSATLLLLNSLVDGNSAIFLGLGGGIYNEGGLVLNNSTIAFNTASGELATGAGIATTAPASLMAVTIARNTAGANGVAGVYAGTTGNSVQTYGSVISNNLRVTGAAANCGGPGGVVDSAQTNVEDGSTCQFEYTGSSGLSPALVDAGGDTDVLTITTGGVAKGHVTQCFVADDQRNAQRTLSGVCDAGAFEEGAVAPAIDSGEYPMPGPVAQTPVTQPPVPAPTATPVPTPVFQQSVVAKPVRGKVRFRPPGSKDFVELDEGAAIPVGSTVDTKKGTVEILAVPKAGAAADKAQFRDGIFRITQSRGITDLKLTEPLAPCSKRARTSAKKPKTRKLWGDGKGAFRTSGSYAAATVRGTKWLVQDSCAGTLTRVTQGVVSVRDKVKKKTFLLRAPKSYTARPRR